MSPTNGSPPKLLWIGRNLDSRGASAIGDFNGTVQEILPNYTPGEGRHLTLLARALPPPGSENRSRILKALAGELTTPESLSPLDVKIIELDYYSGRAGLMSLALTVRGPDSHDFGRIANIVLADKTYPRNPFCPHITIGRFPEGQATNGLLEILNKALSFRSLTLERVTHTSHCPRTDRDLHSKIDDRLDREHLRLEAQKRQAMSVHTPVRTIRPRGIPSGLLDSLRP